MKILITTGSPWSNLVGVTGDHLNAAGLLPPKAMNGLTVEALHDQIQKPYRLNFQALPAQTLQLDKVWEQQALSLLQANLNQNTWGWANSFSTWLLDFWKNLDPAFHFVLVYSPPEVDAARGILERLTPNLSVETIEKSWLAYNTQLLRFYNRNKDRAVLVGGDTQQMEFSNLISLCNDKFDLSLSANNPLLANIPALDSVSIVLAKNSLTSSSEQNGLYTEMQASATLPRDGNRTDFVDNAITDYLRSLQTIKQQAEKVSQQGIRLDEAKGETELLLIQLHQVQEELESFYLERENQKQINAAGKQQQENNHIKYIDQVKLVKLKQNEIEQLLNTNQNLKAQIKQLEQASATQNSSKEKIEKKRKELEEENELLLLQLHQVQEELEHYFILSQSDPTPQENIASNSGIYIPASQFELSENWYSEESDDKESWCWSGPEPKAKIIIPTNRDIDQLLVIHYKFTLKEEQLTKMTIAVDGEEVQYEIYHKTTPNFIVINLPAVSETKSSGIELTINLPQLCKPSEIDSNSLDHRPLGIAVYAVSCVLSQADLPIRWPGSLVQSAKLKMSLFKQGLSAEKFPLSHFNGIAYLQEYPDVASAVEQKTLLSALIHYVNFGYSHGYKFHLADIQSPSAGDMYDLQRMK